MYICRCLFIPSLYKIKKEKAAALSVLLSPDDHPVFILQEIDGSFLSTRMMVSSLIENNYHPLLVLLVFCLCKSCQRTLISHAPEHRKNFLKKLLIIESECKVTAFSYTHQIFSRKSFKKLSFFQYLWLKSILRLVYFGYLLGKT